MEIIVNLAPGKYVEDFCKAFSSLHHRDQKIRISVMNIISNLTKKRLMEAHDFLSHSINEDAHKQGLLLLIDLNTLTPDDLTHMIHCEDALLRKYGIIAARKLYEKYPQGIKDAIGSEDSDLREFARQAIETEKEFEQLINKEQFQ